MSDNYITKFLAERIGALPPFINSMSKDARKLRDYIYEMAITHAKIPINKYDDFLEQLRASYDPVFFERAIMYDYPDRIIEAVNRRTSTKWDNDTKKEIASFQSHDGSKGTKAHHTARSKNIDWMQIAIFDDYTNIWLDNNEPAKVKPSIHPSGFTKNIDSFRIIYKLITEWMPIDFNREGLWYIWNISNHFSADFTQEMMEQVQDIRKRHPSYLSTMMFNEHKIRLAEAQSNKELDKHSQGILDWLMNLNNANQQETVDLDKMEREYQERLANERAFKDIKIS